MAVVLLPTFAGVGFAPPFGPCWIQQRVMYGRQNHARMQFSEETLSAGVFNQEMFDYYANPSKFEGTELTITEYPSPTLRNPNKDITEFDDKLQQLAKEFFAVMYGANGVGLAAPQVGLNINMFVYNTDPTAPGALKRMGEHVVCNPKIIEYCQSSSSNLQAWTDCEIEGCLSSRSECCRGHIRRAKELQVEYQDERGRVKKKKLRTCRKWSSL